MDKHIVAIGGGGFGRSVGDMKIEKYIVSLSNSKKTNVCFIPTASGDSDSYKVNFYRVFSQLGCNPTHIDFFQRALNFEDHINNQDIIYVGGGNTKSMLGVWKEWGLDKVLNQAYENGVIMSGVSAGAICWFNKGITDSFQKNLSVLDGLGFIEGICCPHYDEEKERIPYVESLIKQGLINSCISIEGGCALHIKNDISFESLCFGKNKKSYLVSFDGDKILHTPYNSREL